MTIQYADCGKENETTEHLLGCSTIGNDTIYTKYLQQVDDIQTWRRIADKAERFERAIDELECDTITEQRDDDLPMEQ